MTRHRRREASDLVVRRVDRVALCLSRQDPRTFEVPSGETRMRRVVGNDRIIGACQIAVHIEVRIFAAKEEVLPVQAGIEGVHVSRLRGNAAGRNQTRTVDADFRTILEVQSAD